MSSKYIIIVDDEKKAAADLKRAVEKIDAASIITTFTEADAALAHLAKNKIDIAFLDIEMSEMTGLEFANRAKLISPKTNIIFVTAHSDYALEAYGTHPSGYLMKPVSAAKLLDAMNNLRFPAQSETAKFKIQTFGNFEVFVHGKPIIFSKSKAKELLAYLIDRRGASVTTAEAAIVLWESKVYSRSLKNQMQLVIMQLTDILKNFDASELFIREWNSLAVNAGICDCDYYRFLQGDAGVIDSFSGEYMSNYSWAEFTTGFLQNRKSAL